MAEKIRPDDEGNLFIACHVENGKLVLDFGKMIKWIAFDTPEQAIKFAEGIIKKAKEM